MRLSYCTNIHPSDSWEDCFKDLSEHAPLIREHLNVMNSSMGPEFLGLGLRLSASAASALMRGPRQLEIFREWLEVNGCFVETLNGFPYGSFYGKRIKEDVFRPDWTSSERVEYTKNLACILNALMPDGLSHATISTVPVSHRSFHADEKQVMSNLEDICEFLHSIEEQSGNRIVIGMEPEPLGHIDSTEGVIQFFTRMKNQSSNPSLIEKHLGITYDTCHFAVMGESPSSTLSSWQNENIAIAKIQFSNALELCPQSTDELDCLLPFVEPIYSHQTSILLRGGKLLLFPDLPEALSWAKAYLKSVEGTRWRVHYHIPLFAEPFLPLHHTNQNNEETAMWLAEQNEQPQLEVETYTWSVLPSQLKGESLSFQIAKELDWLASLQQRNRLKQRC